MSNAIFPTLKGLGWPVNRKPYFSTIVSSTASGQEVRIPNYPFPLEEFDLPINHLHQNIAQGPGLADFQTLWAFYLARLGSWDSFLYWDPTDNSTITNATFEGKSPATGQNVIATGDGSTTMFQLYYTIAGVLRPIFDVNGITVDGTPAGHPPASPALSVYVAGSPVSSGWTVSAAGMLTFTTAPAAGAAIAVDFSYFKRCRFADDHIEFSNFLQSIYKVQKIGMKQVFA